MPIEIAGITINRIHKLTTLESAGFASHRIPGLEGTVFQDTGRHSTRLLVEGIYFGDNAKDDLEKLRDVYKKRKESDFLAEIVGQAYFSQVVIDQLEVFQNADDPEQFSFRMIVAEYVPPPEPEAGPGIPGVDDMLSLDASNFMDMIQLPDLLTMPDFSDPTPPLQGILDSAGSVFDGAAQPLQSLTDIFGNQGNERSASLPLSGQIEGLDSNSILDIIKGQLDHLVTGGKSAGNAIDQGGSKSGALQKLISGLVPPNLNRNAVLAQGFNSVQSMLPADMSQALGGLDGQIETFFQGLQSNLSNPLSGKLDIFRNLRNLGIGTGDGNPGDTPVPGPAPVTGDTLGTQSLDPQNITAEADSLLALLPDPFDAQALLKLFYEQLASLPREEVPLHNIPVYDELRDKLETALKWLQSDKSTLSSNIVETLTAFQAFIRAAIIEHCIDPVKESVSSLSGEINIAELKQHIDAITLGLGQLAEDVRNGSLDGTADNITELETHVNAIRSDAQSIQTHWIQAVPELGNDLELLGDTLEEHMADLLLLGAPSTDLSLISLAVQPLNKVFDTFGVPAFISGIDELANTIASLIEMLDLTQISQTIHSALDDATRAIKGFSDMLVNVTMDISMVINRIEKAIEGLGIAALVEELQGILNRFEQDVVSGLNTVFSPIRKLLEDSFDQINGFVTAFDPESILKKVTDLLDNITDILGNTALQNTIKEIRKVLDDVNNALNQLSFKPVSDKVVAGIGVVKDAFSIIGSLPLPDSVVNEVKPALNALPDKEGMQSLADKLKTGLGEIIERGPKPVLVAVKDKPAELIKVVEKYSPDHFLGDQLSAPYQEFVSRLKDLKPSLLMAPVKEGMDKLIEELRKDVDPMIIFNTLQEPYNTLYHGLDGLNPSALVQTLQEKLTQGIHAVTQNLPLDATNEIFSVIDSITSRIRNALDIATAVRNALTSLDTRLSGLANSQDQVNQWADQIAARFDTLDDIGPVTAALQAVENAINDIQGPQLKQNLFQPLDGLLTDLSDLDPRNRLITLVRAKQSFPATQLQGLNDSQEKTRLISILDSFDPMDQLFAGALGGMQDKLEAWSAQKIRLSDFFDTWQKRYFLPDGPLSLYRRQDLTLPELKTLLTDTIHEQLTNAIAPVFKAISSLQSLISAVLTEITNLIQRLEVQVASLLQITDSLSNLRDAIKSVVDQLNSLDITFIAREIEKAFDAVKTQLEAIDPQKIGSMLKSAFDHLLDAIDPDKLLDLSGLDARHQTLIDLLNKRDPKVILTDTLQPEYDKIMNFLHELDFGVPIETFLTCIDNLQVQLGQELDRVVNAYGEMLTAIPDPLGSEIG